MSLVPSVTESLIELGAGGSLVGVTDYCLVPAALEAGVRRVGGTRTAESAAIRALTPDLVIANQEENKKALVEDLEAAGVRVWVTFPRSVREAMDLLWVMVELFRVPEAAPKLRMLETSLEWTAKAAVDRPRPRVFCPIWQGRTDGAPWWMTFNARTYAHDVLAVCGGDNVFSLRERKYPLAADLGRVPEEDAGGRDVRYPVVSLEEVLAGDPEVILLPDEPFPFGEADEVSVRSLLADVSAVKAGRVHRMDGTLVTWHGTRLGRALAELPGLLQLEDRAASHHVP